MTNDPSTNGPNGRDVRGRFTHGNAGGPGNPHAASVAALRAALLEAVTVEDVHAVVRVLIDRAKAGEVPAIRELLDRLIGKPVPSMPADQDGGPIQVVFINRVNSPEEADGYA